MKRLRPLYIVGAVVVDQLLKYIVGQLPPGSATTVVAVAPFYNRQLAFSIGRLYDGLFLLSAVLLTMIGYLWWRTNDRVLSLGLAGLIAGGVSNLIDRLRSGFIIDIVRVGDLHLNLADIFIVVGAVVAVVRVMQRPRQVPPNAY
jgi:signal peptidase II